MNIVTLLDYKFKYHLTLNFLVPSKLIEPFVIYCIGKVCFLSLYPIVPVQLRGFDNVFEPKKSLPELQPTLANFSYAGI